MSPRARKGHFTPELFAFLRELKRNNRRGWFERNRDRYLRHVRDPMLEFITDFAPRLRAINPHFVADPAPQGGSMFRIYRDVRFSRDKRPYKTAAAAQFNHERGKHVHAPGFYLHLAPDEVFVGAGTWRPDGPSLARIRRAIVDHPERWKRVVSGRPFRAAFTLSGDSLARPPRGFDPDHPLIEDLRRKDFIAAAELGERAACAPDFVDRYAALCAKSAPFVRFLAEAVDLDC